MNLEERIEALEMQNAFLEKTTNELNEIVTKMNSELFLLNKEVFHLRTLLQQANSPDFVQERLHNGPNR